MVKVRTLSSSRASTVDVPVVVSSSRPPPCTTHARSDPCSRNDASMRSATAGLATPISCRRTRPGLAIGPSRLNTVAMPISRLLGAANRNAGWNLGARQKPMPTVSTQRSTPLGDNSMATPSSSSTSAAPHCDDAARAPCLQTGTPAPATTIAAIVLTLMEWLRSPPVPTMSTARDRRSSPSGTNAAASSTASSRPLSSSGDSPLARRATTKPMSWAAVASPDRMVAIAARACDAGRSRPSTSSVKSAGQPPKSSSAFIESGYAVRRRWRIIRRRSRSVAPPQIPDFSLACKACSRQAIRTSHPAQTAFASNAKSSSSG